MKIALIDIDSHAKKKKFGATIYPNLALCKIAEYHKAKGDIVEWYDPMFGGWYDKAYVSKVFNFTPEYQYPINADEIVRGGTGYDITSQLPKDIDDMQPDYSIYPSVPTDISYGFLTRGCPNKCKWCVVPIKEEVEYLIDVVTVFRKRLSRKKTCFLDMIAFTDDQNAVVNAMKVDRRKKMLTNIRRILRYELKRQKK